MAALMDTGSLLLKALPRCYNDSSEMSNTDLIALSEVYLDNNPHGLNFIIHAKWLINNLEVLQEITVKRFATWEEEVVKELTTFRDSLLIKYHFTYDNGIDFT